MCKPMNFVMARTVPVLRIFDDAKALWKYLLSKTYKFARPGFDEEWNQVSITDHLAIVFTSSRRRRNHNHLNRQGLA